MILSINRNTSTHLTMYCLKCLFDMDIHIDPVSTVMFVEIILIRKRNHLTFAKKGHLIILSSSQRFQYFKIFLQIPKLKIMTNI